MRYVSVNSKNSLQTQFSDNAYLIEWKLLFMRI
jgi:hypothetical protein